MLSLLGENLKLLTLSYGVHDLTVAHMKVLHDHSINVLNYGNIQKNSVTLIDNFW